MRVRHEGWPPGLHVQLTAQLFVFAYELGIFLFELADAQRWWWERRDLFGREGKRRLELRYRLLELYDSTAKVNKGAWPCHHIGVFVTCSM